jgi:ribosomal protein S18 acetylase RimI-like enzyme
VTGFTGDDGFRADLTRLAVASGGPTEIGAGYIVCDVRRAAGAPAGGVRQLGVVPAWRRRGVATALLVAALRAFRAEGLARAVLEVNVNNPEARQLYAGLGFEEVGRFTVYTKPWRPADHG